MALYTTLISLSSGSIDFSLKYDNMFLVRGHSGEGS